MIDVLVRNWWVFVIRGVIAVLFGLIALFRPGVTILSLVLVFAAYAIVDGILSIISGIRAAKQHERWAYLVFVGFFDIVAGLAAAALPSLTVIVFVALIAAWALITGAFMLAAAFRVDAEHGRWWFILSAIASLVFGALLVFAPMMGALVLTWWIGVYAIIFGVGLVVLAFRLHARETTGHVGRFV
jgi:uncharacterized membrane protein HdeD (DUF308 family)